MSKPIPPTTRLKYHFNWLLLELKRVGVPHRRVERHLSGTNGEYWFPFETKEILNLHSSRNIVRGIGFSFNFKNGAEEGVYGIIIKDKTFYGAESILISDLSFDQLHSFMRTLTEAFWVQKPASKSDLWALINKRFDQFDLMRPSMTSDQQVSRSDMDHAIHEMLALNHQSLINVITRKDKYEATCERAANERDQVIQNSKQYKTVVALRQQLAEAEAALVSFTEALPESGHANVASTIADSLKERVRDEARHQAGQFQAMIENKAFAAASTHALKNLHETLEFTKRLTFCYQDKGLSDVVNEFFDGRINRACLDQV